MSVSLPIATPWPIETEIPTELAFLANHISTYLTADPPYNNASLRALIFTPPPQPLTLLLIQVSQNADPHAFSCAWELPSGYPNPSDPTLLHALARVILEQTGLHLSRAHTMSGSEVGPGTFENGNATWMKLQFVVSVSELESSPALSLQQGTLHQTRSPESHDINLTAANGTGKDATAVSIKINQEKHQRHAWVTETDLMEFIDSGLFPVDETKQYQSMLDAFAFYRQSTAQSSSVVQRSAPNQPQPLSSAGTFTSGYGSSAPANSPAQLTKTTPKRGSSKAGKQKPSPSHFHRFRIS